MIQKIKNIIQINITQEKSNIKTNVWKFCVVLFLMATVSIYSSFSMDKKIHQNYKNEKKLEQLKSSFVAKQKIVNELRDKIIIQLKEKSFGFIDPVKEDIIIIYKSE